MCPVSAELHPTSLRSRSTCPCRGPHRLRSSGRKQLSTGDARTQTWGLSGCRTSANAQRPLLWTCPEVGPLQSDVLVAADVCCSPSPPGAARGARPADASRGKAGGGRGRVSDPAGLGAAVCTSCGGGTPRGHRREDRRRCRVLGAVIKLSCVLLRRTPGRKRSGAGEGRAQAPPLSTRSLTLRVLALGGSSLRQICTSCFSQFFPPKSFKCKNLRKRSFRCCPAPRRHTRRLRRESAEAARPWRARGRARRGAVSVGGDGDVCSSDSVDLVRKPSPRIIYTVTAG